MASSSSESGVDHELQSSPLRAQNYLSDETSANECSNDDQSLGEPPDLEKSPCSKRRRYGLYRKDPSVPVPRETLRRWNLPSPELLSDESNTPTQDLESIVQFGGCPGESLQECYESSSGTECEGSSESEGELVYEAHDSDSSSHCVQEEQDDFGSNCNDSEGEVLDDSESDNELFCGSLKTTDEAVLDVCNLFLKHRWTKGSLNDTLKLMAVTLPHPNNMPNSLYALSKYVNLSSAPCSEKPQFYCRNCLQQKIAEMGVCNHCSSEQSGVFYYFSISDQLKYFFENDKLIQAIDDYRNIRCGDGGIETDNICDISDGSEYKRVKNYATGPYDVILEWNSDGVSLSDSSDIKFYPLLSTICEVAPRLRSYYIMVNAIWVDSSAPLMSTFLKPFAFELQEICEAGGIQWKHPKTGAEVKSQVFAPLFVGDAPLRADVLEVMRYNSMYGCEGCEQKATKLPPKDGKGRSLRRLVFLETPATERTVDRMRVQGEYAKSKKKKHVKGVKGRSIIEDIPHLNRAKCTLAEYMHSILLGVTRHFATMWLSKPGPWFIGNRKEALDKFLSSIKVIDFMRDARTISKIAYFKASEFRSWLLFFSLVALLHVDFPYEYLQHWILLVKSMYILLQDQISESDLVAAELMLKYFLRNIHTLYSDYDYLYNVHQLSHLVTSVRRWGPLSVNSTFMFENYNGVLSRMVHGTKHQAKELTENLKLARCIHVLHIRVQNSAAINGSNSEVSVCGKADKITLTDQNLEILRREGIAMFQTYRRASFKGVVYTSLDYDINKKKCNSLIKFRNVDQICWGEIICFLKTAENVVCYVEMFKVRHWDLIFHRETMQKITHLMPVDKTNEGVLVEFPSIICKVFKVGQYIAIPPNKVETHL